MMADKEYIEREALIAEYDRVHKGPAGGARKLMVDAPAVDVVEVVRCKDCRHAEPFGVGFVCRHSSYAPYVSEMHYCANGWRKNNAKMDGKGEG